MVDEGEWSWFSMLSGLARAPAKGGMFICFIRPSNWLWSPECCQLLGVSHDAAQRSHNLLMDLADEADRSSLQQHFDALETDHSSFTTNFHVTDTAGLRTTLQIHCYRFEHTAFGPVLGGWLQEPIAADANLVPLRVAGIALDASDAIVVMDTEERVLGVNLAYCEITGYSRDEVIGGPVISLRKEQIPPSRLAEIREARRRVGKWSGDFTLQRKDGGERTGWCTLRSVFDAEGNETHIVATLIDRTQERAAEQRIQHLKSQDQLTGLPNRSTFHQHLEQTISYVKLQGNCAALLLIDLDHFKFVNAAGGYEAGDHLLQAFARCIGQFAALGCMIARIGSDEFCILLEGLDHDTKRAADKAAHFAQRVLDTCKEDAVLAQSAHQINLSIGITIISSSSLHPDQVLKEAALAMYEVKKLGSNAYRFFDVEIERAVQQHLQIEAGIRSALHSGSFELHYQPQVDANGVLTGLEALIRWPRADGSFCAPMDFIPAAEGAGMMPKLGRWILARACQQIQQWATHPVLGSLPVAVNVSTLQFNQAEFIPEVLQVISEYGIDTAKLKLEVTESVFASEIASVAEKLALLRAQGIRVALDDFGTGYSSLAYLRDLPIDQLKIDRAFVQQIENNTKDMAIARTIVTLAKSIGITVIAEGVEVAGQRDQLIAMGCDEIQGYLVAKPMAAPELEQFAVTWQAWSVGRQS